MDSFLPNKSLSSIECWQCNNFLKLPLILSCCGNTLCMNCFVDLHETVFLSDKTGGVTMAHRFSIEVCEWNTPNTIEAEEEMCQRFYDDLVKDKMGTRVSFENEFLLDINKNKQRVFENYRVHLKVNYEGKCCPFCHELSYFAFPNVAAIPTKEEKVQRHSEPPKPPKPGSWGKWQVTPS
jgi:hypothetical protein